MNEGLERYKIDKSHLNGTKAKLKYIFNFILEDETDKEVAKIFLMFCGIVTTPDELESWLASINESGKKIIKLLKEL